MIELKPGGLIIDRALRMMFFTCGICGEYDERPLSFYNPLALDQRCKKCQYNFWVYSPDQDRQLTTREIAEAFPDEINDTIVPRLIRAQKRVLSDFKKQVKTNHRCHFTAEQESMAYDLLRGVMKIDQAESEIKRLESYVESMLMPPPEQEKGFTAEQVEHARRYPLLNLYAWEKLRKNGQRHSARCPFHTEKSPSFVIYSNNSYHCFGCQANGQNAVDFLIQLEGLSFVQAVARLQG